jgi:hypothetical protein
MHLISLSAKILGRTVWRACHPLSSFPFTPQPTLVRPLSSPLWLDTLCKGCLGTVTSGSLISAL